MNRLQRHIIIVLLVVFLLNIAVVTRWCLQHLSGTYECTCGLTGIAGAGAGPGPAPRRASRRVSVAETEATYRRVAETSGDAAAATHGDGRTLSDVLPATIVLPVDRNSLYWQFCMQMSAQALYSRDTQNSLLRQLLTSISTSAVLSLAPGDKGTQLKFFAESADGSKTIVKMMKTKRDYEVPPDLFYFSEFEKHNAEIAAYHLDRVLGWRRVPPCIGRLLNISSEMEPLFDDNFRKTVYTSPAGNRCFHGHCKYFCETAHSVCGDPIMVEASFCVLLPYDIFSRKLVRNPWRRSYSKRGVADWQKPENNYTFCVELMTRDNTYAQGRLLLDLIDLHIFDFLMGNQDRHHFESFGDFENGAIIAIDNGRGFSRTYIDDLSILAPLYQCCKIRKSTYDKLLYLSSSTVTLSDLVEH